MEGPLEDQLLADSILHEMEAEDLTMLRRIRRSWRKSQSQREEGDMQKKRYGQGTLL